MRALVFPVVLVAFLSGCVAPAATAPPAEEIETPPAISPEALADAFAEALERADRELMIQIESAKTTETGWTIRWSLIEGYDDPVPPEGELRVELYDVDGLASVQSFTIAPEDAKPHYERFVVTTVLSKDDVREARSGGLRILLDLTLPDGRGAEYLLGEYDGPLAPVLTPFEERFDVELLAWGAEEQTWGYEEDADGAVPKFYMVWAHLRVTCLADGPEAAFATPRFELGDEADLEVERASTYSEEAGFGGGHYYGGYEEERDFRCEETPQDELTIESYGALRLIPDTFGYDVAAPWDEDPRWHLDPAKRTDERPPFDS